LGKVIIINDEKCVQKIKEAFKEYFESLDKDKLLNLEKIIKD